MIQTATDSKEPIAVAKPIGNKVEGNSADIRYAPGTRTNTIAKILCKNDKTDFPYAQK